MTRENMVFRFQDERAETVENHRNPPESSKLNRLTPSKTIQKTPPKDPSPRTPVAKPPSSRPQRFPPGAPSGGRAPRARAAAGRRT